MSVRDLVQITPEQLGLREGVLREGIKDVEDFGDELRQCIADLKDTLHHHEIAIGLSAPQIGIPLRVAVVNLKQEGEEDLVLVNPEILSQTGKKDKKSESCMSLPNYRGEVVRRDKVTISFLDESGQRQNLDLKGFRGRVVAHEIDHLNGILYPDRMENDRSLEKVDFF